MTWRLIIKGKHFFVPKQRQDDSSTSSSAQRVDLYGTKSKLVGPREIRNLHSSTKAYYLITSLDCLVVQLLTWHVT